MNGSRSIGENSADWVGKDVIWRAYKKMDVSRMPKLIGFENTSLDQLYFRIQALVRQERRDKIISWHKL